MSRDGNGAASEQAWAPSRSSPPVVLFREQDRRHRLHLPSVELFMVGVQERGRSSAVSPLGRNHLSTSKKLIDPSNSACTASMVLLPTP
jgi:hypothetical protein